MEELSSFPLKLAATFVIGTITFLLLIWYSSVKQSYWKKRGIPYVTPCPIVGTVLEYFFTPLHEVESKRYLKLGPIYGHYEGNRPLLSVGDLNLLRDILVKDFTSFVNRRPFSTGDEIFDKVMPILENDDWKRVRTIVSPAFSTGKLKRMLSIFKDSAKTLMQNFKMAAQKDEPVDVKKLFGAFSMDVIASSAFSTKLDSHNDPDNKFVRMAKITLGAGFNLRFISFLLAPRLMKFFGIAPFNPKAGQFFTDLTRQIIEERKKSGLKRNDFLQLLIDTEEEMGNDEKLEDVEGDVARNYNEEISNQTVFKNISNKRLSMKEIVAQCTIFFLAGYENIATVLNFTSHLLATNEDVQEKTRQEIIKCLEETSGELTYETLRKMKYLDNVISESLRLYPPAIRLERKVEMDYKLEGTDITVPKGMMITSPTYSIHRDPKFFSNPEKFDPNRFTPEERAKWNPYAYLPFGAGPRNCIGMRFSLLEIKMCLVYVISCFNIKTCPQTHVPIQFHACSGQLRPKDILLKIEPREDCPFIK